MAGGLINIITYGANDLYLTGAPEITLFKTVYRRHTNYSSESVGIPLGKCEFGNRIRIEVPKTGDLMKDVHLQLEIPAMKILKSDLTPDSYTPSTTLPLSEDQELIVDDYQTILDFMTINTLGYKAAYQNKDIINQSVEEYIELVLDELNYTNGLDIDYQEALSRALDYERSIGNRHNDFILFYKNSDIKDILNTIASQSPYNDYTVAYVFDSVQKAIDVSVEVQNYYFEKVHEKFLLEQEYASKYAKFAWVEKLGQAIIDKVDVCIGGERIDRRYGDFMNVWYELTGVSAQQILYDQMMGNVKSMITFDSNEKPKYILSIPLLFWFNKLSGLAFPLIALQHSNIAFEITFKKIEDCAYVEKLPQELGLTENSLSDIWENLGLVINGTLFVEYIYLDYLERKRFAQTAHEYLIETVDDMYIENTSEPKHSITLDFKGPCKEFIWTVQKTSYLEGFDEESNIPNLSNSTNKKMPFNYSYSGSGTGNPVMKAKLMLNGYDRFESRESIYSGCLQPYVHHTRTPSDGINVFSVSLHPQEFQPSSCCNLSRIGNPNFSMEIDPRMFLYKRSDIDPSIVVDSDDDITLQTRVNIRIYTIRYSILRIIGGLAGFAHKYIT